MMLVKNLKALVVKASQRTSLSSLLKNTWRKKSTASAAKEAMYANQVTDKKKQPVVVLTPSKTRDETESVATSSTPSISPFPSFLQEDIEINMESAQSFLNALLDDGVEDESSNFVWEFSNIISTPRPRASSSDFVFLSRMDELDISAIPVLEEEEEKTIVGDEILNLEFEPFTEFSLIQNTKSLTMV